MTESSYEKALREMYEMGVEHGRELQRKDAEIKRLEDELIGAN